MNASTDLIPLARWCAAQDPPRVPSAARHLIKRGRIPQAVKVGRDWLIPADTRWPTDLRLSDTD